MVENTVENSLASELSKAMPQFCETVNRHQTCLANPTFSRVLDSEAFCPFGVDG